MLILGIFSLITAVALPHVNISPILLTRVTSILFIYSAVLSFNAINFQAIGHGLSIYSGLFQVTSVTLSIDTFLFLIGGLILLPWAPVKNTFYLLFSAIPTIAEYPMIILFTTCGASFLISSGDLVSLYLSIELQSFALYILATLYRDSESATSAGLKYFLLGGLSSCFILLGSAFIYSDTGLTNIESIFSLLSVNPQINNLISPTCLGFIIIMIGFLFKISAAPFHHWAPDVYDGVPTIVTTWLSIMPKISICVFLLEIQSGFDLTCFSFIMNSIEFNLWKNLLIFSSLLSLLIGTIVGLAQYRLKRLLAYSTISHVGFLLLALSINSEESIDSFLFYLVQYTVTNLNAFFIVLAFGYSLNSTNSTDLQFLRDLTGQFWANPILGFALAICLFSIAGVPPLIGFFGKQIILYSALQNGYYFISFIAILVSVISASYYLKIVRIIHFDHLDKTIIHGLDKSNNVKITTIHSFVIAVLTLIITLFIFKPSLILNSTHLLALTLFQY